MISIKIHRSYRNVVAACDSELIGKKFEEGKLQLDIRENFYKNQEVSEEELKRILILQAKEDSTFNIIGEKAIKVALEVGIIDEDSVSHVNKIPFALTLI